MHERFEIRWHDLRVIEPAPGEVEPHAARLAAAYNDPRNALLLGHTSELSRDDVLEHYASLGERGGRPFLLLRDGALAGDADLRGIRDGSAEFAFLIADPDAQGRGLGTRFATMIHALAFTRLALARVYASVIPVNVASRRVFEKLGYEVDDSDVARAYADEGDVTLSIGRSMFVERHADAMAELAIAVR